MRLLLLGGASIEGPEGPLSGRVVQPRQLALLALLASARGQPVSRNKLVAVLWPESTAARAHHSLADTVYVVNHALEGAPVEAVGNALRLDPLRAVSDVAEFEQAIEAGELERAVGLYRGPFLEGFHLRGADEFEAWSRSERERLERAYDRALERLAEEARAKGEVGEAVDWLRRWVELDPFAARAVRGLMETLAASGDRAGALKAARAYAVRLKEEYGLEPEVEVVELEQTLRTEPTLASPAPRVAAARRPRTSIISAVKARFEARRTGDRTARWIPELTPRQLSLVAVALALLAGVPLLFQAFRDTGRPTPGEAMAEAAAPGIAVLPFQATGPGLDLWREGMIDLLSTNLDGAGGLRAIDSRTVLARWGETVPAGTVADLATSLEAARKTGARWAVVGKAVGLGSQVRLSADVYELESGRNLGQAQVQGAPDSVYMLVDRLAIDVLRTVLGPRRPDLPRVELARVTTSSLPALKAYLEGELLYRRADIPAAIEAYRRAVEADTTFALAYMRLAQTISWLPPEVQAEEGLDYYDRRAVQYADRLPEREAILVRAQSALYAASLAMLEPLRQATRRFPDDPELWYLLADYYFFLGDQILLPDDEVRRAFDRLLAMDPTFALFYFSPIVDAFQRADSARTLDLLTRYERLVERDEPRLLGHRLAYELAWGGPERRARALAAADTMDPLRLYVWDLLHPRFLAEGEALARIGRPTRPGMYMHVALFRGRTEAALSTLGEPNLPPAFAASAVYTLRDHGAPVDERFRRAIPLSVTDSTRREGFWIAAVAAEEGRWETHRKAVGLVSALATSVRAAALGLADSFRSRGDTLDETRVRAVARALDAYATWRRGDRETALHELIAAQKEATDFGSLENDTIRWWIVRLLQELDRPRETEPWLLSLDLDPYAHLELGRLYERLGRRDEARERYELFVTAWRDADPALQPKVAEARQALTRLGLRRRG